MAALVRNDAMRDEGLCREAASILIRAGLDSHSDTDTILDHVFRYVQRVKYIHDPGGNFDAIHSARETLAKGYGDCDDLSVLLATLLACLGFTPSFVMAKYSDDTNGFDHIYVEVETTTGDGGRATVGRSSVPGPRSAVALDPTSRTHGIGWENPRALDRVVFPIFGAHGAFNSLGGAVALATTGAQIGLSFVPVVGPILSALVGPFASMFDKSAQRSYEAARDAWKEKVNDAMLQIQAGIDNCQITPEQGAQYAREVVAKFYAECDANLSEKVAKSCRNYGPEPGGFDWKVNHLATKNPMCALTTSPMLTGSGAVNGSASTAGSSSDGGLGGLSVSLPALLLGGGLLLLLLKR